MTRGERAKEAREKYQEIFDEIVLGHTAAHQIKGILQKHISLRDLTAFRDAFYLRVRIIGSEQEKYRSLAAAIYNQCIIPLNL